ncbi:MAG: thioredoxin [Candidatus Dormiibacterota bacterium]
MATAADAPAIVVCANCGTKNRVRATGSGAPFCGKCGKPLPWLVHADDGSFDAVVDAKLPVLVDFWAPWCGPCRMVTPVVEKLAVEKAGQLKVVEVNTDDTPILSRRFDIKGIPLLVVMKDGKEAQRVTGALPEPRLRQWLQPFVS